MLVRNTRELRIDSIRYYTYNTIYVSIRGIRKEILTHLREKDSKAYPTALDEIVTKIR